AADHPPPARVSDGDPSVAYHEREDAVRRNHGESLGVVVGPQAVGFEASAERRLDHTGAVHLPDGRPRRAPSDRTAREIAVREDAEGVVAMLTLGDPRYVELPAGAGRDAP